MALTLISLKLSLAFTLGSLKLGLAFTLGSLKLGLDFTLGSLKLGMKIPLRRGRAMIDVEKPNKALSYRSDLKRYFYNSGFSLLC